MCGLVIGSRPAALMVLGSKPRLGAQEFSKLTFISRNSNLFLPSFFLELQNSTRIVITNVQIVIGIFTDHVSASDTCNLR